MLILFYSAFAAVFLFFVYYHYMPKVKRFLRAFKSDFQMKPDANLPLEKQWALLTGAILAERNSQYLNSLDTGMDKSEVKEGLQQWWGIANAAQAAEMLSWLKEEGHRQNYAAASRIVREHPQDQWHTVAMQTDPSGELDNAVQQLFAGMIEMKNEQLLTPDDFDRLDILSWDYARLINTTRWCYDVGFISEEEAWQYILPAAKALQRNYQSWEDLAKAYLLGRAFWNGTEGDFSLVLSTASKLIQDENSPWKKIPWNNTTHS